ncbi:hypothetical protein Ancab_029788 [Ancistrocladus abbreviatus]
MATATATAEDSAKAGYEGSADGGAGGKFRKRPLHRHHRSTPYDRPPTALRSPRRNGWFSRIIDPASKLITAGAHKLFSSVFPKILLPLPRLPPDENEEPRDSQLEAVPTDASGAQKQIITKANDLSTSSDRNVVTELEHVLKQKTFTRSEIDRLTELCQPRRIEKSSGTENEKSGSKFADPADMHTRCGELIHGPVEESGTKPHVLSEGAWTPPMGLELLEEDMASPADLAKAYMGSRPAKVSPSMSGFGSQTHREDRPVSSGPFHLLSPNLSLPQKPVSSSRISENGLAMPRPRGRSAIYCMPRIPSSRIHPTLTFKDTGALCDAKLPSSTSFQNAVEAYQFSEPKKLVLKRRSSVLDNDIGSIGPIRRIRQKTNLLSSKTLSLPASALSHIAGSDVAETPHSLAQGLRGHSISKSRTDGADIMIPVISSAHVSSKSIEMGQRILQQLDKMPPKGKSAEKNLGNVTGKSPAEMTPDMIHGLACRSLETVDSFKLLQSVQDNNVADGSLDAMPNTSVSSPKREEKDWDNSQKAFTISSDQVAPENSSEAGLLNDASLHTAKATDSAILELPHDPLQNRRAFRMSALEDYVELDDDVHSDELASTPVTERRENLEFPSLHGKAVVAPDNPPSDERISLEQQAVIPHSKPSPVSSLDKNKEPDRTLDGLSGVGKSISFTFPVAPTSSPAVSMSVQEAAAAPQTMSESHEAVPTKEVNAAAPAFSLSPRSPNKVPPFAFSTLSAIPASPGLGDSKPECTTSFSTVANAPDAVPKSRGHDNTSVQDVVAVFGKEEIASSLQVKGLGSATGSVSSQMAGNGPAPYNGTLGSGSVTASSFSHALFSSSNQSLSNGCIQSTSTSTSTMGMINTNSAGDAINGRTTSSAASSGSLSTAAADPSFSAEPIFKFGSSAVPATSPLPELVSSGPETIDSVAKPKETDFGSQSSSVFVVPPPATATTASGIFGSNALATTNGGSQPQTTPDTGPGPVFGVQASHTASLLAAATQSMPSQLASSTLSPTFGPGGTTTFSPGSSLFGSSVSASNPFSSDTSFGSNSSESSSKFTSMTSSSGASGVGIFGSTWQPSKTPTFGSAFNSTTSTVFSFGASSGSTSGSTSAPILFGATSTSATTPVFSFNSAAPPVASTTFSLSQPSFGNSNPVFSFGLTTSGNNNDQMNMEDSMAEDSIQAPAAPAVPAFGQSTISPTPSNGFIFGTAAPSGGNPFQFNGQPNQLMGPQNAAPFQPSGSLDAGGSFSLGTGGTDKSARKFIKVRAKNRRK